MGWHCTGLVFPETHFGKRSIRLHREDGVQIFLLGETLAIGALMEAGIIKGKGPEPWLGVALKEQARQPD